jgi:homoserine kinase
MAAESLCGQSGAAAKIAATNGRATDIEAELAVFRAEIARVTTAAAHASELSVRDAQLKDRLHQADREHLLRQVVELKSALVRGPVA